MVPIHVITGLLSIGVGFVALYSTKGTPLHRRAGMLFVYSMLTMATFGTVLAAVKNAEPELNIPAGLITLYLVITALTTVRSPVAGSRMARWLHIGPLIVVIGVAAATITYGIVHFVNGDMLGVFAFFQFAIVAVLAGIGDLKMLRTGPPKGAARISRHLWRMTFALYISTTSFFLGQSEVIPEPVRIMPLLAAPVLAVLLTMFYWLWRVRSGRSLRGGMRSNAIAVRSQG